MLAAARASLHSDGGTANDAAGGKGARRTGIIYRVKVSDQDL
jgi:hypothetical protein